MELWDGYFKDGTKADITLIRGKRIPKGLYHLVSEILVRHKDGTYLLMKRDENKPTCPGLYEATAGGSAYKGEDKTTCAKRELEEETGIVADKMEQITRVACDKTRSIYYVFLCDTDCEKTSVRLQPGETTDYMWVNAQVFRDMAAKGQMASGNLQRLSPYLTRMGII